MLLGQCGNSGDLAVPYNKENKDAFDPTSLWGGATILAARPV